MGKTAIVSKILSDIEQDNLGGNVKEIVYLSSRINEISIENIFFSLIKHHRFRCYSNG